MSILGNRVRRREDRAFLTTGGMYGDDLVLEGALHATFLRSTVAHAKITSLEVAEALGVAGVVAVFTGADIDLPLLPADVPGLPDALRRPVLATDVVRFVGEPVAVVLAESRLVGEDALEAIFVDYEPLPVVVDPLIALRDEVLLFPDHGSNVAVAFEEPLDDAIFDDCEVVVRQRLVNQRVAPCPLEVRSGAVRWGDDGRLTQWASNQAPHGAKATISALYGLEPSRVRVIAPDVGGGFGAKIGLYAEDLLLPWLARATGRAVRWTETRSESMLALGHGRAQVQDITIGGSRDGRVAAYRLEVVQDAGAYPSLGAFLPFLTRVMASGTYDISRVEFSARSVVTNTTPTVAYRGAGRPEATAAIERAMDLFAAQIGLDPAELRRRNLVDPAAFPYTTPMGTVYDVGEYERALDLVLDAAGYGDLRKEQAKRRSEGRVDQLGVGMSTYVEITNGAGPPAEFAAVEIHLNGTATVYTGTSPHGQGHLTAWSMLASEQLGIPMDDIDVVAGDTDRVTSGGGTMGSRSLQSGGLAVHEASLEMVELARGLAAESLEASLEDVVLDRIAGRFHVVGTPALGLSWGDIAAFAAERHVASTAPQADTPTEVATGTAAPDAAAGGVMAFQASAPLRVDHDSSPSGPTFPFGAHVAVVEVDTETGAVRLVRLVAVDDAGTILNPLLAEGQRHGGLAQGAAQALLEEVCFDPDGNPVTANLADYAMISATELPSFELVSMETPTPVNVLGAKGIGESGTIGSTPAVQSAVIDALSHLGIRHLDMPATPIRVWTAISAVSRKEDQ